MEPLAVSLRSVVAVVGGYPVLAGTDLEVRKGEVVAVRGANGAGKTSLLRVIAGLLSIREGTGRVFDIDLGDRNRLRGHVGFVGHDAFVYEDLSVRDNVEFFAGTSGTAAVEAVGLGDRVDLPAGRLSEGQRRRLALAVVMARAPRLWLLDEPYSGLDAESRDVLGDRLVTAAACGSTVIFTTHDTTVTEKVATRCVEVVGGRLRESREAAGVG